MIPNVSLNVQFFSRELPNGRRVTMMRKWVNGTAEKSVVEKFPTARDIAEFPSEFAKFTAEQGALKAVTPPVVKEPVAPQPDDEGNPFAGLSPAPEKKDDKPTSRKRRVKQDADIS